MKSPEIREKSFVNERKDLTSFKILKLKSSVIKKLINFICNFLKDVIRNFVFQSIVYLSL